MAKHITSYKLLCNDVRITSEKLQYAAVNRQIKRTSNSCINLRGSLYGFIYHCIFNPIYEYLWL